MSSAQRVRGFAALKGHSNNSGTNSPLVSARSGSASAIRKLLEFSPSSLDLEAQTPEKVAEREKREKEKEKGVGAAGGPTALLLIWGVIMIIIFAVV